MEIRKLSQDELPRATCLIWKTFIQFVAPDYTKDGINAFKNFITSEQNIDSMNFLGAFEGQTLIGVLSTIDEHICCFFVDGNHHKNGVGRKLFNYFVNSINNLSAITVNSSPFAVEFYHALGFKDSGEQQTSPDGIKYTPMHYTP